MVIFKIPFDIFGSKPIYLFYNKYFYSAWRYKDKQRCVKFIYNEIMQRRVMNLTGLYDFKT